MKKLIFLLSLISFVSCKTLQISELRPTGTNEKLLPALEPQIDMESFQFAYSMISTRTTGRTTGNDTDVIRRYSEHSTTFVDKRIQDATILFERDLRDNITLGNGKPVGRAVCKIPTGGTKITGAGWLLASTFTFTILNWFGMPAVNYTTELELEVEIMNCNEDIIGRYTGYGFRRIPLAAWHGYDGSFVVTDGGDGPRKSNIDAFQMAMTEIKSKIAADYDRLKNELESCEK